MIQLLHGDCLELMPTLPDASVDAIIADLPYGTTDCEWDSIIPIDLLWAQYKRIIKPRGAVVLFGSQPFSSTLICSNPSWFKHDIVWEKDRATGHLNAKVEPLRKHEDILVFCDGRVTYNPQMSKKPAWKIRPPYRGKAADTYGKSDQSAMRTIPIDESFPTSVYPCSSNNLGEWGQHPTQKPVKLLEYLIRTYTNAGETVLDNTMGSGTAGVACVNTGRVFIGMELDADYFATAQRRIAEAQMQPALFTEAA